MKVYKAKRNINDSLLLQADLDRFRTFCVANKLFLNYSKCKHITFSRNIYLNFNYSLDGHILAEVIEITDLGLLLDCKLNFNKHINNLCIKTFKMLGFIIRTGQFFRSSKSTIIYLGR